MASKWKLQFSKLVELFYASQRALRSVGLMLAPLALRVALALPFYRSGRTRWEGYFHLAFATPFLFEDVFKLHLFGHVLDIPAPDVTAYIVAVAEIVLPVLLIFGLGTRTAALGLLIMTGVIQLVVPEGWANFHLYWAAMALAILALGPGKASLDFVIGSRVLPQMQLQKTEEEQAEAL